MKRSPLRRYGGPTIIALALVAVAMLSWRWTRRPDAVASTEHVGPAETTGVGRADHRVDPRTMPRASIAGTVTDERGTPIARAQVCAEASSAALPSEATRDPRCTGSDEHGAYVIDSLLAARYEVVAGAKTYRPGVYHPAGDPRDTTFAVGAGEHKTGIDVVLRAGGVEVTGTVADVGGGPIAHAQVRALTARSGKHWGIAVETDVKGGFSLWTDPGDTLVQGAADGYDTETEEVRAPGNVMLYLTPESSLAGTVVDAATGSPVEGVRVELGSQLDDLTGTTDERGRFRITRLPPGRYLATARGPHRYGRADGSTLVGLAQHVDGVVIRVFPASEVAGTVVIGSAADAKPCPHAVVGLLDAKRRSVAQAIAAGDDGAIVIDGVPHGTYTVQVACSGHHARDHYDPIMVADADITGLVWPVDPGATLRGRVVTKSGTPVEDATVAGAMAGTGRQPSDAKTARSGKDGTYELTGLAAGTYRLDVTSDAGVSPRDGYRVDVAAAAVVTKDLELDDTGTIRGTVVDAQGTPVGGVDVFADPHGAHAYGEHRAARGDGTFAIEGVRPGQYRVVPRRNWDELRKPGTNDDAAQGELVTVAAGQTATVRLVVEPETGRITGFVVDADGQPVPDAYVSAARESDAAGAPSSSVIDTRWGDDRPALTGPDGAFTLGPFAPASYTLRAYRKGGGEAIAEHVAVGTTARLQIKRTGSIAGTATRTDGASPDELDITVSEPKTGFTRRERFYRTAGAFAIRDLPAGAFVLTATAPGSRKQVEVSLSEGETKTGVTIELDATVTITGRVVEMGTQQPVPGLAMVARAVGSVDSSSAGESVTDDSGRFSISDVPTGRVDIRGYAKDPASGWTTLQAVRTISGTTTVDVGDLPVRRSRLAKPGDVHGYLGLHFEPLAPGTPPEQRRVKVSWIDPAGPAAHIDIRVGDVLASVDGVDIRGDNYGFTNPMLIAPIGTTVTIVLERGVTVSLTLGTPP